ncbi:MAG: PspC domain-containing protein [Bacteroidales bacterium]|nr:PspC domain-containing protein [Bacteroidales bacterium]
MKLKKNIVRNAENTKIAGVCGAIAELFGIDAKTVRIVYVFLSVLTAFLPGFFLYMFLMLIIPKEMLDVEQSSKQVTKQQNA